MDLVEPGVAQGQRIVRLEVERQRIVGLFVLTPADVADPALVVEDQPLAADGGAEAVVLPADPGLIELRAFRIDHSWISRPAVGAAVVAIAGVGDTLWILVEASLRRTAPAMTGIKRVGIATTIRAVLDAGQDRGGAGLPFGAEAASLAVGVAAVQDRCSILPERAACFASPCFYAACACRRSFPRWPRRIRPTRSTPLS